MRNKIVTCLIIVLLAVNLAYPQVISPTRTKFKQPAVVIELLFGYSQPLPNLYGDINEFFSFKSYGVKYGFGSQLNVKLVTNKKGTIRPYFSLGYLLFRGTNNTTAFIGPNVINSGYPLGGSATFPVTGGTSDMFLHNFSAGFGFEYAFVNKTRWTPHLGGEADLNVLFGTYRQDPGTGNVSFTIKQAARFGFGVGGGIHLRISKVFGFGFSTKYKFANVLGKASNRINELNKMELLDKSAPELNSNLNKDRHIDYFEFMLGVVFYAGRK